MNARHWRSQVRFLEPAPGDPRCWLVELPAWAEDEPVTVALADLPVEVAANVRPDYRCHARARLAVADAYELDLRDWEAE